MWMDLQYPPAGNSAHYKCGVLREPFPSMFKDTSSLLRVFPKMSWSRRPWTAALLLQWAPPKVRVYMFWGGGGVAKIGLIIIVVSLWFVTLVIGLKRVLGYSYSGRCQTSTWYCRPTRVLGIYNDSCKLCCKVVCGDYFKAYLTSAVITFTM